MTHSDGAAQTRTISHSAEGRTISHSAEGRTIPHWFDNKSFAGTSGNTAPVTNPATGAVTGQVALASVEDARAVIDAAAAAFPAWRDTSLAKRSSIVFKFRELLNARKGELAEIITSEHGKVVSDALGEVSRGQEVVEFACGMPHLLKGGMTENASTNIDVSSIRQPVGPVGIISPFNFPAMVPMWFFPIAIAAGNTVVLKPSEKDPTAAIWMAELWAEAGLPAGVFNVLQGDKTAVDELLTNPAIKAISFVGSTPIAQYVYATGTAHGKRVQALGGAKNHAIVLPDADLDLAADAMVNAGFGSAGERCMAISALVAVGDIADELVAKIKERTDTLKIGDGTQDSDMGPLVTKVHRDKVASYIDAGEQDGATIVVDGRTVQANGGADGFWLGPTLIDHVTTDMSVYTDEIFGPVLSVIRVESYDEALELVNSSQFGNGTAIFTNDGGAARRFQNEVEVGMVGINVPIPVPTAYYSFGGWKNSLFGDSHAHGTEGVHFFTRGKVVTSRWLDPSHGGINLGFPQNN
ncbi:CoA-acylating methylmalonate-semialdehyde dehydrogenase [Rhodococcus sp. JS3073]|uniref:CoA-acylating methylmalonate-semialdehyde dehydrogenase n=1 Tax=Rhodococcus sp. JS3073 TaxID=3002901 RepID=UPI0022860620|nr:CoA-acylating methylmalonate-semialdehyde dehydrogenase [Rhodococcus sp. JS3073]WAM17793.1 CoA-acylating methylmalonate-semialdehyde dehydrogenase [Rhodococcus sp. JS3073]